MWSNLELSPFVVILTVILLIAYKWYGNPTLIKSCQKIPQNKPLSIVQDLIWFKRIFLQENPVLYLFRLSTAYCKMFHRQKLCVAWVAYRPYVIFYKPDAVEDLLNNAVANDKSWEYRFLHPWLGTGLLTSSGKKWRSRRKLLTSSFHFRILEDFVPIFNEQAGILVEKLGDLSSVPCVDIVPLITRCTLDIICETAMGVRMNAQSGGSSSYVKAIMDIADIFITRSFKPWLWIDFLFNNFFPSGWKFNRDLNIVHSFTRKVIKEKKESVLKSLSAPETEVVDKTKKKAFLELLLEHHIKDETFTEEDIREEVDTFMFEGHDTTAMAISWTLYCLGLHPEIQEKLYQELEDTFQGNYERTVTCDDIKNMRYLDCVLKETLRLYPSVPLFARELKEPIKILDYSIEPGCLCLVCVMALHRDPEQFPEPEKFNPDRFLPEISVGRHPYAYIPFSAGPRNCIGQRFALIEEKIVLTHVLRKFKVTSMQQRDKVDIAFGLTLKNLKPVWIHLTPRTCSMSDISQTTS